LESFLDQITKFSDPSHIISLSQLLFSLILTLVLCLVEAKTYEKTYRGASFSPAFMHTIVICGMVISAVMIIIGSNIARAFSLVGALSIVRFRNAVKDPRDVAYIFLSMAIGMACGTGFYQVAVGLTVVICSACLLMYKLGFGESDVIEKIARIRLPAEGGYSNLFDETLRKHTKEFSLLSVESLRAGSEAELTFLMRVKKGFNIDKLIQDLRALHRDLQVQIRGTDHVLEL
jgi:uncharacterized membrane protein YhiD involved in acid resistance